MVKHASNSSPDDPRLTAYLLDELEPAERAAFEAELAAAPELRAQLAELRKVSSALGRLFQEEKIPGLGATPKAERPPAAKPRTLSPTARAGRIARLKADAPKLGNPRKKGFNSLFWAAAAALALMAVYTFQQIEEITAAKERNQYVRVDRPDDDAYNREEPLEKRMEAVLSAEKAASEADYEAVARAVETGLAEFLEGAPRETREDLPGEMTLAQTEEILFGDENIDWNEADTPMIAARQADPRPATVARRASEPSFPVQVIESRGYRSPASMVRPHVEVRADAASYGQVRSALQAERWPSLHEVKIDELINYFEYAEAERAQQTAAASRPVEVDLEVGQAPWEPAHYLVRVTVNTASSTETVKAAVRFNPTQVAAYRLLGYEDGRLSPAVADTASSLPALPEGGEMTALYEVVPVGAPTLSQPAIEEGFIEAPISASAHQATSSELLWMEVRSEATGDALSRRTDYVLQTPSRIPGWRETSASFRWAAAVASFGMELKDDPLRGGVTWDLVEALARSVAEADQTVEQREFLELIDDARRLERENLESNG